MSEDLLVRLELLLAPRAATHGFELVAVEVAGGQGSPIVRVYLDRDGGIDLDAICSANEWISAALDETDPFNGSYTLEVSSPGIDRPLRKLEDFRRFTGSTVTLKTRAIEGRTRFTGQITEVEGDTIVLDAEETSVRIAFAEIVKANLKGDVDFGQGKGGTR